MHHIYLHTTHVFSQNQLFETRECILSREDDLTLQEQKQGNTVV